MRDGYYEVFGVRAVAMGSRSLAIIVRWGDGECNRQQGQSLQNYLCL